MMKPNSLIPMTPTPRSNDLFQQLGKPYFFCKHLSCWITEESCKLRHEIGKEINPLQQNDYSLDVSCWQCDKYTDNTGARMKTCVKCGKLLEANTLNFYINIRAKDKLLGKCVECCRKERMGAVRKKYLPFANQEQGGL